MVDCVRDVTSTRSLDRVRSAIASFGSDVDKDDISTRLARSLDARPGGSEQPGILAPRFGALEVSGGSTGRATVALQFALDQLRGENAIVEPQLVPSRIPVVGRLVDRIKQEFHNLVIYYVNINAARRAGQDMALQQCVVLLAAEVHRLDAELNLRRRTDREAQTLG